ncbi:SIR2 family NAD-dependent protein deacylase [Draconibacterium halophilum]|uniref:protein acetyllysine N-acetyltransferase n=1 Tax=Draconibacterium halophilum TaxID=2706887 RepID=A0A6C0RD26_9BACT|nr:Sir2 family NAD-dependent protein deacetylase [Draconibacterium halophilum]QIA08250.1 RNA polymerase subunit sigma [Draconibacterium halophilum]
MELLLKESAKIIKKSNYTIAFTGAGISVESGIPPFRGEYGLWNKYRPQVLDLSYFLNYPGNCWGYIREIFYDFFADAKPNDAHRVLANMERNKLLNAIVTQNIDNLHYDAGNNTVHEFHGNSKKLICLKCGQVYDVNDIDFENIPPKCVNDNEILKPNFIFFGEGIPQEAYSNSFAAAQKAEVCIIVGSTGEVTPASYVPRTAKQAGATIIEINPEETVFTSVITDIHLKGKAAEILNQLGKLLF